MPYQFKLRFLYGFNPPLHEALGYGKGLHDALAEMHKRALAGDVVDKGEAEELVERHLHTPYAYPELESDARNAPPSRRSSATSTSTARISSGPSTARSRSRSMWRPGSQSTAAST